MKGGIAEFLIETVIRHEVAAVLVFSSLPIVDDWINQPPAPSPPSRHEGRRTVRRRVVGVQHTPLDPDDPTT